MMKGKKPAPEEEDAPRRLGRKLAVLRTALNKTQSRLARDSKVKRASISQYEADQTTPDASTLERLLTSMGFQWSALDLAGWFLARLFSECTLAEGESCQTPNAEELEAMAADMTDMAARLTTMARVLRDGTCDVPESEEENRTPTREDRAAARQCYSQVRGLSRQKQREKLREAPAKIRWALCELLCLESQRLCADDPKQAASLAELALELAGLAPGEEGWRAKLRGLAWAHIGNALRARGEDLPAAETAFASAEESWRAAEQERITVDFAREVLFYLRKARYDPDLKFEWQA
jgi:transcriptional regulator with XRE-family HTH domain